MLRQDERVALAPFSAAREPRLAAERVRGGNTVENPVDHGGRVGDDRQMNRRLHLRDLRRVDVDHHLRRLARQTLVRIRRERHVEASPDDHETVGVLEREVRAAWRDSARPSEMQRMIVPDEVQSEPRRQDGDAESLGERNEPVGRTGQTHAVTDEQDGTLAIAKEREEPIDGRVELRYWGRLEPFGHGVEARLHVRLDLRRLDVERKVEPY